ncbi:MAG TPA: cell division protein ZapE [Caulobacteraceae bacterium]
MATTLRSAYAALIQSGEITPDPGQEAGLEALTRLEDEMAAQGEASFLSRLRRPPPPRGVYLWGPVGRGKSMLMDLFFEHAPVEAKRRDHFYAFMAEVQGLLDAWRKGDPVSRRARFGQARGGDPIAPAATLIASKARLLCFDELQVVDIADAMILGRLFKALFEAGVVVVATSNRRSEDLYQDGINRELFLPFIDIIEARMQTVCVGGARDHRLERLRGETLYFAPLTAKTEAAFDALWLGQLGGAPEIGATLEVKGRKMRLPRAAGGLLRASFASLCGQALGAEDYLALAARFHTVFLEGVPRLGREQSDEAHRFMALIDTLYQARTRLVVQADAEPAQLYPAGKGDFEFQRTASRLEEMRSAAWMNGG